MPYKIRKNKKGEWEVYNPDSGKIYGTHPTRKDAEDQLAALYANAPPEDEHKNLKIRLIPKE
jgi:hypothetical protein